MISRKDAKIAKESDPVRYEQHLHRAAPKGPLVRGAVREKA